jgi:hypothetical protein
MVQAFHLTAGEVPKAESAEKFLDVMARHLMEIEERDAAAAKRFADYEPD